jgi:hypothetical protein
MFVNLKLSQGNQNLLHRGCFMQFQDKIQIRKQDNSEGVILAFL